jgi:hypothetical protein
MMLIKGRKKSSKSYRWKLKEKVFIECANGDMGVSKSVDESLD